MSDPIHQPSTQPIETTQPVDEMPQRKRVIVHFSMRLKLIIAFLGVSLIPLGLLAYYNYVLTRSILTDTANASLKTGAETVVANIDDFIESNQNTLREVARWPEVTEHFNQFQTGLSEDSIEYERIWQALQRLQDQNEYGATYALLDRLGNNVVSNLETDQEDSNQDYISIPFYTGYSYVSPILFDSTTGESSWYFSAPVMSTQGQVVGVVRAKYNADVLQQIIEQYNGLAGNQSFAILLNESHIQLAHGTKPNLNFKSIAPILEKGLNNVSSTAPHFTVPLNETGDGLGLAAFAQLRNERLPSSSWSVVFVQPQDVNLNLLKEQVFSTGVAVLLIVVVVFVVTLNLTRMLINPLTRLSDIAQKVASGALGLHAPVESRDEVGELAKAFNSMTIQMRDLSGNLDQYIAERTRALGNIVRSLETSTQIGRQITTILDINELLQYVVNRIQIEFNFYYTHIYLVEEETRDLVMAEGSGEIGHKFKARGHRLEAGQGIVGTVASTNEYFLSNDVSKALNFVSSPLLPDTRSELALPLRKGGRVLGVLDIQDDEVNRFTSADISLMQSIANQTAVAIDNAQLLAEAQAARKQAERLTRRLTREGWDEFGEEITTSGYRFRRGSSVPISPDTDVWLPPMKQAALERQLVKQTHPGNGDSSEVELAVPLVLRGEVIGVLGIKREETKDWAEEEVAAVEAVANQVTLALENARLSREQEKTITQLKEVDRIKSEFLTSMSHELRTPLNSIIGFADVILQGIDGEINEMAMNDVRLIYNSGQHLLALINDILDLAKIEAGKLELVREPLDIEETINDVLAGAGALVKNKPVKIISDITEALPAVYADKLRFNQVLLNLITNAVKFTDEGTITVSAKVWKDDPNQAIISVVDEGIGIPPDMMNTIFDRFSQVDASTRREAEGTGLGLAICKQLVEMHGGMIEATSEVNVGSDFHFTIPFVQVIASAELVTIEAGN